MFSDVIGHKTPKTLLARAYTTGLLAHAYLFHGEEGIGKRLIALRFIQATACERDHDCYQAGGTVCRACRQIEARTHPDVIFIEPDRELANPQIKIEQIREIEEQIIYRPLIAPYKCVLIDDADRMTIGAANALLKTLEEPPGHSLFVLVTSRLFVLPSTIKSRCQAIRFAAPPLPDVEAALAARRGLAAAEAHLLALATQSRIGHALQADLDVLRQHREEFRTIFQPMTLQSTTAVLQIAETLAKSGRAEDALEWLAEWIRDLILIAVGADPRLAFNRDHLPELRQTAGRAEASALVDIVTEIDRVQRNANRNLNVQLVFEGILLRLRTAFAGPPPPRH